MNPYPSYKDSGVEWIGDIPSHWKCKRLQYISEIENSGVWGKDEPFEESLPLPIPTTGQLTIEGKWIYDGMDIRHLTKSELNNYRCIEGDIVVVKSSGSSTNIITGKCGYINSDDSENFGFSNFLLRIRPMNLDSKLTYYFLQSNITKQRIERMVSSTTYPNLKVDEYVKSILFIPPPSEQTQIVSFLDTKTQKIDKLIEKTEQKIKLLKEKQTSLINHCVTKGLNPNVEMKDSGVEWIGEIPSEWGIKKIKYLKSSKKYSLVDGPFGSNLKTIHYVDDGDVYIIESGFITSGKFQYVRDFKTITNEHFETIKRSECNEGDIIISKIGEYYGMCGILPKLDKRTVISGNSVTLTISKNHNTKFIHQVILQHRINGTFKKEVQQTGQPFISLGVINNLIIPTPNLSEQTQIVEYLDEQTQKIDSTIEKETQRVELLKEYRQSLISEVVTGKIDVRDWNG